MTQKRYSLSDSDMLGITKAMDKVNYPDSLLLVAYRETWNAILAQEGKSLNDFDGVDTFLDPRDWAIPQEQLNELSERLKKKAFALGFGDIAVTNLLIEYIAQYGPATYNSSDPNNTGTTQEYRDWISGHGD